MIVSIEIENLRGIRSGRLDGLGPLTILTGPNGCGKSTVLDALLIAASPDMAPAVGEAVSRHPATPSGARWLVGGIERKARVAVTQWLTSVEQAKSWERSVEWYERCEERLRSKLIARGASPPFSMAFVEEGLLSDDPLSGWVAFSADNQYEVTRQTQQPGHGLPSVSLIDPGLPRGLEEVFSEVAAEGRREEVQALLRDLVPGFERIEILALGGNDFALAVTSHGRSVPLGLSGDGIQAFVQLALGIAAPRHGLVMVEEPEVYQHPKAIWKSALALLVNARRGVQTVITTHSLELIDALVAQATADDLKNMALFNLALEDGQLRSGRRAGEEIQFARETLESDLR